jgi:DNA recombination protein RmuC
VRSYNDAIGSLESRVLVSARRFRDLQAVAGETNLEAPPQVDALPREVRAEDLIPAPDAGSTH